MIGMRPAESSRSNAQWYDPWLFEGAGKVVASLTVPFNTALLSALVFTHPARESHGLPEILTSTWNVFESASVLRCDHCISSDLRCAQSKDPSWLFSTDFGR